MCDNQNVTLICHTDENAINITWQCSDQSQQGDTIAVNATLAAEIVCTCFVSNNEEILGNASVSVRANGECRIVCMGVHQFKTMLMYCMYICMQPKSASYSYTRYKCDNYDIIKAYSTTQ